MTTLSRHGSVYVLRFSELMDTEPTTTEPTAEPGNPENVFSPDLLDSLDAALDEVEASEGPAALVTTGAGRFYSNGLDLGVVASDPAGLPAYVTRVQRLFARVLRLELPTVAAVNGHAFGAGAMLAVSHDHRVMRSDRGYWNLPEARLGMPFPAGMNALVTTRLGHPVASTAMLTARRYPAAEAVSAGIAHEAVDAESVLDRAVAVAAELASLRGPNYSGIRAGLVAGILPHLDAPVERL
ncbi:MULTISPECIES: enoyl-CoA hydratase/isomerase family protein [Dietzia]|uniref:Enoyl-CoA hydratase/isomerase family protein n=1 Tax=Dietzia cinnamea TaxID=321318 RepID=A0A4V2W804_9ACTN|nr:MULTISPECIES: enoyl-CoA hydratase/isomerase family protein [Dietzia]AVM64204.1 enoyl-CoA hydratase/isomerase family protein [Dietzia sp. oral taxon 368]MCT1865764.1 enoyl-CoA hydratase/isomerase family protein [Dietzia cinnamea]MCT1883971.1 enoyl-CoA hydratase/isomerase family protein [Dietzia cinnamea]MCT2029176.1 enoyl-CoA hydratase/isomerase family protein [Dietzia cinnamea]MCT2035175.1 enoyl-CoA hydratase/isomerase family protein [Dietzia cinnamea]